MRPEVFEDAEPTIAPRAGDVADRAVAVVKAAVVEIADAVVQQMLLQSLDEWLEPMVVGRVPDGLTGFGQGLEALGVLPIAEQQGFFCEDVFAAVEEVLEEL